MKILVTGAGGYLGQGIVNKLLEYGCSVIATDIKTDKINPKAEVVCADLFSVTEPYDFFGKPDAVLHLAWRDGFVHYSDAHFADLNKHFNFIETMYKSGVKRIAVMGSMHEIGFWEGAIKEGTPCNPLSYYGISKNALRQATEVLAKNSGAEYQWLRGYYIVGNTGEGSSIFSKITTAVKEGKKVFPFTLGQNQYDFIDYDEFCTQTAKAVMQNKINGIINICSGRPEKLADRVERFIKENGYDIKLKYGAFPDRPYDSKAVWGDNKKIKEILEED